MWENVTIVDILGIVPTFLLLIIGAVLALAMLRGKVGSLSLGRDGLQVKNSEAIQVQSMTLARLLDGFIVDLDGELLDFAYRQARALRKPMLHMLNDFNLAPDGKRNICSTVTDPLNEAARQNKFKVLLRPANVHSYIGRIVKRIKEEYEFLSMEHDKETCPKDGSPCAQFPGWDELESGVTRLLMDGWATSIKEHVIKICEKKMELYQMYKASYEELGDNVRGKIAADCFEKNQNYIRELQGGLA